MITIKFKKSKPDAQTPTRADNGSAGWDLYATDSGEIFTGEMGVFKYIEFDTGIIAEIPRQHVGLLFPRSSISNTNYRLSNSVGVIDSSYRGSIKLRFKTKNYFEEVYKKDDRIGQLVIIPYPEVEWVEMDGLSETERGDGGFGSSGI